MTSPSGKPPTLEEWQEWAETATRNWTDEPIGHNPGRRLQDARGSRLITTHTPIRTRAAEEAAA